MRPTFRESFVLLNKMFILTLYFFLIIDRKHERKHHGHNVQPFCYVTQEYHQYTFCIFNRIDLYFIVKTPVAHGYNMVYLFTQSFQLEELIKNTLINSSIATDNAALLLQRDCKTESLTTCKIASHNFC